MSQSRTHARSRSRHPIPPPIALQQTRTRARFAEPLPVRVAALALLAAVAFLPLVTAQFGQDMFRAPKDLFFRGAAIVLAALTVIAAVHGHVKLRRERPAAPVLVAAAAAVVAALTTIQSTNVALSLESMTTVAASLITFGVTWWLAPRLPLVSVYAVLVPAVVNAFVVASQRFGVWDPLSVPATGLAALTAFVGNSNDVGASMVAPFLVSAALFFTMRRKLRIVFAAIAVVLMCGAIISLTLTAIGAMLAGLAAMSFLVSWKRGAAAVATCAVIVAIVCVTYSPLRTRVTRIAGWLQEGQYNNVLSERLTPFLAAATMAREHPFTGVGPGTFQWHYMPYHWQLKQQYGPELIAQPWVNNYGQVHNDHLQLLAEGGIPAYLVFLGALATLVAASLRRRDAVAEESVRTRFVRLFALPFAVAFFVLALAGFPLQLAVTTMTAVFLSALVLRWSDTDETDRPLSH